jgi:hypothetical protein
MKRRISHAQRPGHEERRHSRVWISGWEGWTFSPSKDTSNPGYCLVKSLGEIHHIAQQRDIHAVDELSDMELSVLLDTLSHFHVDEEEEASFTAFYQEIANRIRNRSS